MALYASFQNEAVRLIVTCSNNHWGIKKGYWGRKGALNLEVV